MTNTIWVSSLRNRVSLKSLKCMCLSFPFAMVSLTCYGVFFSMLYLPSECQFSQVPTHLSCHSAREPSGSPAVSSLSCQGPPDTPGPGFRGNQLPLLMSLHPHRENGRLLRDYDCIGSGQEACLSCATLLKCPGGANWSRSSSVLSACRCKEVYLPPHMCARCPLGF